MTLFYMPIFPQCADFQVVVILKRDHELKVHGVKDTVVSTSAKCKIEADDMYNYQCFFIEYLMLLRNFKDAISEGEGGPHISNMEIYT